MKKSMAVSMEMEEPPGKDIITDDYNDNPIEEVRLTVPITEDPSIPCLTFRTWVLGIISCAVLGFLNNFFGYRANPVTIGSLTAQIVVLPIGKFMAATLPSRVIRVPLTNWTFSFNPGPFNLKEHVLITIFASAGASGVYAVSTVNSIKAYYHRDINPLAAFCLFLTTQMLGYGCAGLFRKVLVESPYMWWPSNLVQVSLFSALHEKEKRPKGGLSKLQFFLMVTASSFAYYILPNYFFPSLTALSVVCWIWKDSVTAHQIGAGLKGLGLGSFALDWGSAVGFLGSPLATPGFAIINILVGFALFLWVLVPITYWTNTFDAKKFPMISPHLFTSNGSPYNISQVINLEKFDFNQEAYNSYSKVHLGIVFALCYGLTFATLTATISHVALFHGKSIWKSWRKAFHGQAEDIHMRLMKNYDPVPQWWFLTILVAMLALSLVVCEGFGKQLQLPWWGLLLAFFMACVFTFPIGVIQSTTNQGIGINVITELVIGYLYPGKPLANMAFKTYGYMSMAQALYFLQDFKLGHYMKIPPKSMFIAQLASTVIASSVCFGTVWWMLATIPHICDLANLPEGSPWTCPYDDVFYNASIIWGVIGPLRMFGHLGLYVTTNWFFLIGFLAPVAVWLLLKKFPENKWIRLIHMPMILAGATSIPPAGAVHFITWGALGLFFNTYVYRKHKAWWARNNYILSAGLDAGVAFMAILVFFSLQNYNIFGMDWWGLNAGDHCPLASCPTAPGIVKEGCPVF